MYDETLRYTEEVKKYCNVVSVWECEWNEQLMSNALLKAKRDEIHEKVTKIGRLMPENALYGGRNEVYRMRADIVDDNTEIGYHDYVSLYPSVMINKKNTFPVGVPQELYGRSLPSVKEIENRIKIDDYFGLVFADILPPDNMLIPILPYRAHNKLFFGLCTKCIDTLYKGNCKHNDSERTLASVVIPSVEVKHALNNGYKLVNVHEIWNFEKNEELFHEFFCKLITMKVEASGYPSYVKTEEDKKNILKNTGRRVLY